MKLLGVEVVDILMFAGIIVVIFVGFIAFLLPFIWLEAWLLHRAEKTLAASLEDPRHGTEKGPGAWKLGSLTGRRAGCSISIMPQVLDGGVTIGRTRLKKSMGVRLTVRGTREVGRGDVKVKSGALAVDGTLQPFDARTERALIECREWLSFAGTEAHADYALPLSKSKVRKIIAVIDAVGPYLAEPNEQLASR